MRNSSKRPPQYVPVEVQHVHPGDTLGVFNGRRRNVREAKVTRRFDNPDGSLKLHTTLGPFEFATGTTEVQAVLR